MRQKATNTENKEIDMKMKKYKTIDELGKDLGIASERIEVTKIKTKLKKRIIQEAKFRNLTAIEISELCGLSRTTVSGILNGSLQSVSIERLIRLASALDLVVDFTIKNAA